jgi:hypothetical protein
MDSQPTRPDCRVEVSGWDAAERFFVEEALLEMNDEGERFVHLRHPVHPGLTVFLRLIDSPIGFPASPIAYEVKEVTVTENEGVSRVRLLKLHQRRSGDTARNAAADSADLL